MTMIRSALAMLLAATATCAAAQAPVLVSPLPAAPPRPLLEDSFCQVAGVDRTAFGVGIFFSQRVEVQTTAPDGYQATRTYDPAELLATEWKGSEGPILYLGRGSRFSIPDGEGGTCSGEVLRNREGSMVVQMTAQFTVDGEADTAESVIYAQPTGASIREGKSDDYDFHASWPEEIAAIPALDREFRNRAARTEHELARIARRQGTGHAEVELTRQMTLSYLEKTLMSGDDGRLLAVLSDVYEYSGGAHGLSGYRARLWDRQARAEVPQTTALFADGLAALWPSWCAALDARRAHRSDGRFTPGSGKYLDTWDCPDYTQLAVVPVGEPGKPFDRIRIIASPYVAGPYSDGDYDVTFPVTAQLFALVKPEYQDSFRVWPGATGASK